MPDRSTPPSVRVLTVGQVFGLAERVGRRPVGNIRGLAAGGYRLRFRQDGEMRTFLEAYATRADAARALWELVEDGRSDYNQDLQYRQWTGEDFNPAAFDLAATNAVLQRLR